MAMLNKNDCVFDRDENGQLLAKEILLEGIPGDVTILATPITRGEFLRIHAQNTDGKNIDDEIIVKHCISPTFTLEEVQLMRAEYAGAITSAIVAMSLNKTQAEIASLSVQKMSQMSEEMLKKK